jgi:hypothetical protein
VRVSPGRNRVFLNPSIHWVMSIALISLFISLLILGISGWTLYLSQYKEHRSEVELQESESQGSAFVGGTVALEGNLFWSGQQFLNLTNTGEMGAYISSISHELVGLREGDKISGINGVTLEENRSTPSIAGNQLESHSTIRYRPSFRISPEGDVSVLMEHDAAVIRYTLMVEDNKGAYEVTLDAEIQLIGPEQVREMYEQEMKG